MAGKNTTASGEKINSFDILNKVNQDVTQQALLENVNEELQETAKVESEKQLAEWEAQQKHADVEDEQGSDDDFDDDVVLKELEAKRIDALKARYNKEKELKALGHGEYREIVEEEFLKEVCKSSNCVVHFYHKEFLRCKVLDQHLRAIAQKYVGCKFLYIDSEKAPFFVAKLQVQMLPALVVFKDGIVADKLEGFEDLGGKDTFRTEVLELWLSKAGAITIKAATEKKAHEGSSEESADSDWD